MEIYLIHLKLSGLWDLHDFVNSRDNVQLSADRLMATILDPDQDAKSEYKLLSAYQRGILSPVPRYLTSWCGRDILKVLTTKLGSG